MEKPSTVRLSPKCVLFFKAHPELNKSYFMREAIEKAIDAHNGA